MLFGKRVAVIVPAYNEERLLGRTLATMPSFVDAVFVVDDASSNRTAAIALAQSDARTTLIRHEKNQGVGAAIVSGYRAASAAGCDVLAVMAGDAQMHPDDLPRLIEPVARGEVDYAKGDWFAAGAAWRRMPKARFFGGRLLSFLTRLATGFEVLSDSQCGYTALAREAVDRLSLDTLWPRYGYPNDLLGLLARANIAIRDVPVQPIYADEQSGVRAWHFALMLFLIARTAVRRVGARGARPNAALRARDKNGELFAKYSS